MPAQWLTDFYEAHGEEIARLKMGEPTLRSVYGLNFYKSKEAAAYCRRMEKLDVPQGDQVVTPKPIRHLVIGDAHAKPGQSLERFTWLGRMCAALRPDVIICIGDWADMPSLSHYDKGKACFEGRRYLNDIRAANEALALFHDELPGDYTPRFVYITGNHEVRIDRRSNNSAEFQGLLTTDDLDFERLGWEIIPFLEYKEIDGVVYSHYFTAGNTDRAISGEFAASALIRKQLKSCVAGHSHLLDYARRTDAFGRHVHGLVVGCYTDAIEEYAGPSNAIWWRGICVLDNVCEGDYDLSTFRLETIRGLWG